MPEETVSLSRLGLSSLAKEVNIQHSGQGRIFPVSLDISHIRRTLLGHDCLEMHVPESLLEEINNRPMGLA